MKTNRQALLASALLLIALAKIVFFFFQSKYGFITVGGTSDADYYDAIALGALAEPNAWGQFLKLLNGVGLYDRYGVAIAIALLNVVVTPWLFYKVIVYGRRGALGLIELAAVFFMSLYPTVNYYTTDIYRDVPMVVVFLVGVLVVQYLMSAKSVLISAKGLALTLLIVACLGALYTLRFYLAAAMVIALVASHVFNLSRNVLIPLTLFVLTFTVADEVGVFNWMKTDYRLTYAAAGSAFGIDFAQGNFWLNFLNSLSKGLYGVHFSGWLSTVMFVTESVPALMATAYVTINRRYIDKFAGFLVIFFVAYASIWVVGVDSLGTAARYRVFNYLAIILAACVVHKNKQQLVDVTTV
jgi:hypothetical protein